MELSKDEIKIEFKKRRLRQLLLSAPVVVLLVFLSFIDSIDEEILLGIPDTTIYITALLIIVGILVFSFVNWRCPSCNKYLGKRYNPKFCSHCGAELR